MIAELEPQPHRPDIGLNRPLIQVIRPAPSKAASVDSIGVNRNRDLVREIIEENVLPDLLETADQLLGRGIPARVTVSEPDEISASDDSPLAAWAKIEVYPEGGTRPAVLGFIGNVHENGWSVTAYFMEFALHPSEGSRFCGPLPGLANFTREQLSVFFQSLVPAA